MVQALLLMTYWYETPDDQKDTWHWMGVAISLAHTIGLHRNPSATSMPPRRQKLWKRIWWSCFMRDRLVALGMRRPTRIKDEDFDVPMLEEADFEIEALPDENKVLGPECALVRDLGMQRQLATLCVEKAKLCLCVSHTLKVQYSVLNRDNIRPENTTASTMMLFPNKTLNNVERVQAVDLELTTWVNNLPHSCQYRPLMSVDIEDGNSTVAVQRNLLHMVYQTTVSALHRPQFLPASPLHTPPVSRQVQEMSRTRVRDAATHITQMAAELHHLGLERYLPTDGRDRHAAGHDHPPARYEKPECRKPYQGHAGVPAVHASHGEAARDIRGCRFCHWLLDAALRKAATESGGSTAGQPQQPLLQQLQQAGQPSPQHQGRSLDRVLAPGLNLGQQAQAQAHAPPPAFEVSTPPPENLPYLNSTEVALYHQDRTYTMRDGDKNALVSRGPSPPHTDKESDSAATVTPSASGLSEQSMMEPGFPHEEFDWNTIPGTNLDFDQWLQFPAEGVNNSDESLMGIFANHDQVGSSAVQSMDWIETGQAQSIEPSSIAAPA